LNQNFSEGMIVYNAGGEKIGSLIEYDEQGGRLIVQKGWLFPQNFSIPVDQVARTVTDGSGGVGIQLKLTSPDLQSGTYTMPTVAAPPFTPSPATLPPPRPAASVDPLDPPQAVEIPARQVEELDVKDAQGMTEPARQAGKVTPEQGVVFIVHGRDWGAKEATARLVEGQYLEAVIRSEQPNGGRTLIEKFEAYAASAVFAIVLLTPDDIGGLATAPNDVQARAGECHLRVGLLRGPVRAG